MTGDPACCSISLAASLKSTFRNFFTSSMPSPAPHREHIHVPRPPLSSNRKQSLPPQTGQGPWRFESALAGTPSEVSIPRQRPNARSLRGSCSMASLLLPALVECDLERLQPIQKHSIRSRGEVRQSPGPIAVASLVFRGGVAGLVSAVGLHPKEHRI